MASRMNCRYRAPVPFTPLVATVLLASQSIGSRCDVRKRTSVGTTSFRPPVPCISVVKTTVVAAANKPPSKVAASSNEIFRFPKTGLNVYRSSGLGVHGRHPPRARAAFGFCYLISTCAMRFFLDS